MFTDVVILAGGFGERLWPASTFCVPKQFLSLEGGVTFLQSAILRSLNLGVEGFIVIVTRKDLLDACITQASTLISLVSPSQMETILNRLYIIAEPEPKGTASPVILASHFIQSLSCNEHSVLVLTSDHIIGPNDYFYEDAKKAWRACLENQLVCFGIPPTEPATGYGYIKKGEIFNTGKEVLKDTYIIQNFKEKPDLATAKAYLESGDYWWNSGMFAFKTDFILKEIKTHEPSLAKAFENLKDSSPFPVSLKDGIHYIHSCPAFDNAYALTPSVSIDVALAEKTRFAAVVKASFSWDDVGNWDSFETLFSSNHGSTIEVDSSNNFVYSDLPVALCGVKDLIVVVKNNKVLVLQKGKSELVKEVVKLSKAKDRHDTIL